MLINLPSSPTSIHIIVPPAYMACTSFPVIQKAIVVLPQLRPPQGAEALVVLPQLRPPQGAEALVVMLKRL